MGQYFLGAIPIKSKYSDADNLKVYGLYRAMYDILQKANYPPTVIPFVIAQAFHETGNFTDSKVAINNFSGIKYFPSVFASHKQYGNKGAYVKFPTPQAWAIELRDHYLNQNKGSGKPIDAKDYNDYARRLKANKYYSDSMLNYTTGLRRAILRANEAVRFVNTNPQKYMAAEKAAQGVKWPTSGELATIKNEVDARANEAKKDFWDIEKWSTGNKVFAAFGALAALAIITRN